MKKNVNKVSTEFEKILCEEFQKKCDSKSKIYEANKKLEKENEPYSSEAQKDEIKKESKSCENDS